jgi:hypothetical protein
VSRIADNLPAVDVAGVGFYCTLTPNGLVITARPLSYLSQWLRALPVFFLAVGNGLSKWA